MEQMVNVFIMGKQYKVPASLTIMKAFADAGTASAVLVQPFIESRATEN